MFCSPCLYKDDYLLCLFNETYDDDVSTISPNAVHDSDGLYGLGLVVLCWREAAFSIYQIVHELPPSLFFHPDSLECWYLGHKIALSVSA